MTKIKITVPKVHCVKRNDLFGKDEIFMAILVSTAKPTDEALEPQILFWAVSNTLKVA
ncbi:MAG TPA: hypothetical protein PLW92_06045 [Chitinophagales bacterium]|nr:hypothetical protein [Chitinophagales bacterium]HMZ68743.1 hypothetical protein [Chitinophagales bacterium]HMZ93248.1 hypothetical protein [Chitinophagales bacterium]